MDRQIMAGRLRVLSIEGTDHVLDQVLPSLMIPLESVNFRLMLAGSKVGNKQ